jgi:hypothetical protein
LLLLTGVLALALTVGLLVNWAAAAGVALLGTAFVALQFLLVPALVVVACGASFVNNESGQLTLYLSGVTFLIAYALLCLAFAWSARQWSLPRSRLTTALLVLEISTLFAALHGVLAGNSLRYLGLELLPLLGLTIALMVGGLRLDRSMILLAFRVFVVVGLAHVALGMYGYMVSGRRLGGIYFTPIPGMLAVLTFNLLLRSRSPGRNLGLVLLTCAFTLQQIISLTRGYWLGLAAGVLFSCLLYAGRGPGTGLRWRRLAANVGLMSACLVLGSMAVAIWFAWGNVGALLGTRLASSLGTTQSSETASNVTRMIEWWTVVRHIQTAPWFGHGLGYSFHVRNPFFPEIPTQWFVHELYLWIWLKQGIVGVFALVLVLFQGLWLGVRGARRLTDGDEAGWCAGAAGATLYIAVLGLTNYPLAQVNSTFLLAFLWGVALALQLPDRLEIVWRRARVDPLANP